MKRKDRSSSSTGTNGERKTKKTKKAANSADVKELETKLDLSSAVKLLSSLIAPTSSEEFFSQHWEKKPLLIERKDTEFYGSLFSKADLEAILKREKIHFVEDLHVCKYEDGEKEFLNGEVGTRVTLAQITKSIKEQKATLQFHQPQRFKDMLWKIIALMESVFGSLVGANVYITPADSQGLAPHYDDVEVFILQLEGKKQWKLYKPPIELPLDYSADLEQENIGEPTHDFELQAGDMVYFPRGTIHQAITPKGSGHSTHITLSTYQNHTWGNLMTNALTDAIDKAMETDVKFRQGLPINCLGYMGLGMAEDGKAKSKQEDFDNQLKQMLISLAEHVDSHGTVDKMAADFMANRMPPYEQKEDAIKQKSDNEKQPTLDSEVKFRYPEHVRISVDESTSEPRIMFEDADDSDEENEDEEMSEGEKKDSEDESMGESEEDTKPKKGSKSKKKAVKEDKKETKKKGKKGKAQEDSDEEAESDDEAKPKKGKTKKQTEAKKTKGKATKKGKKKEESEEEDEDESEEEESKSKKGKGKTAQKKKPVKGKKGSKKSESDEDEDEDEDKSFDIGAHDSEGDSEEDEESDDEEGPWVFVHHSLNNDHAVHMMGPQEPSVLKFSLSYKEALLQLFRNRFEFKPLKSLPLEENEALYLITSLWSEGLVEIKE